MKNYLWAICLFVMVLVIGAPVQSQSASSMVVKPPGVYSAFNYESILPDLNCLGAVMDYQIDAISIARVEMIMFDQLPYVPIYIERPEQAYLQLYNIEGILYPLKYPLSLVVFPTYYKSHGTITPHYTELGYSVWQ